MKKLIFMLMTAMICCVVGCSDDDETEEQVQNPIDEIDNSGNGNEDINNNENNNGGNNNENNNNEDNNNEDNNNENNNEDNNNVNNEDLDENDLAKIQSEPAEYDADTKTAIVKYDNGLEAEFCNIDLENKTAVLKKIRNTQAEKVTLINLMSRFYLQDGSLINVTTVGAGTSAIIYENTYFSVVIPKGITEIGGNAFSHCTSLKNISIPEGVTTFGNEYAFYGCTSLESIIIPESVTSFGTGAFYGCTSLLSIDVSSTNKNFKSYDGVLYNYNATKLICCPGGKTSIEFHEGVKTIGEGAFSDCSSLTSITIPESVNAINFSAFKLCSSLTSITINSKISFGDYCFYGCDNLSTIYLKEGLPIPEIFNDDKYTIERF